MNYHRYLEEKENEYEALCRRCGACCGAYDDPCIHLRRDNNGRYFCEIYHSRFGIRVTKGGETFRCVPIREIINEHWPKDYLCPYKKQYRW